MKRTIAAFALGIALGLTATANADNTPEPRQPEMPEPTYQPRFPTLPTATLYFTGCKEDQP